MVEKITLERLTNDNVDIKVEKFITQDGIEYPVGNIYRRYYTNSEIGRTQVQKELSEPYKSVIFMIWGDSPTVFFDEGM